MMTIKNKFYRLTTAITYDDRVTVVDIEDRDKASFVYNVLLLFMEPHGFVFSTKDPDKNLWLLFNIGALCKNTPPAAWDSLRHELQLHDNNCPEDATQEVRHRYQLIALEEILKPYVGYWDRFDETFSVESVQVEYVEVLEKVTDVSNVLSLYGRPKQVGRR